MTDKTESSPQKSKGYRTFVLLLLTLIYAFNFIDRQIIGILSPFIQADLGLSNFQLGLLKGFMFALFYTVIGLPIAWLADRYSRVNIVGISLAVWSGFTALTGMANSFLTIGVARMGVGVGEAGGSPPSHSLISDMYPKEERAGALAIYSLGIPLGLGFAYFMTGFLLGNPNNGMNWRTLLIALGIMGIVLAIIFRLVVREPKRGQSDNIQSDNVLETVPKFHHLVLKIILNKKFWAALVAIIIAYRLFIYAAVTFGLRTAGWIYAAVALTVAGFGVYKALTGTSPFSQALRVLLKIPSWWAMCLGIAAGSFTAYAVAAWQIDYLLPFDSAMDSPVGFQNMMYILAITNCFIYGFGTWFGGWLTQKLAGRSVAYYGLVPALSIFICMPLAILAFWVPSTLMHLSIAGSLLFFLGIYLGPSFAIAQTLAPINMRAMSTAIFFLVLNLIALGGGPTTVGFLADIFEPAHGKVHAIRLSITIVCAALAISSLCFLIAARCLPKDWADAQARNEGG